MMIAIKDSVKLLVATKLFLRKFMNAGHGM